MRFGRRLAPPSPRSCPAHLQLELLEDRLPPGDLGLFGTLFLSDWTAGTAPSESRSAVQPNSRPAWDHSSSTAGQWDLLTTLGALPASSTLAVTAPAPSVPVAT